MTKKNPLVAAFGGEQRWVNWKLEERKGKRTKLPYDPRTNRLASSTDPKTWGDYLDAKANSENVGIIFAPERNLLGIDIDHCLNKLTKNIEHEQKETIASLILEADTYTEISPSGEGLHLYLKIDGALSLGSNKSAPFEAYTSGRYFTVTENTYGEQRPVRTVSESEALSILSIIGYPWKSSDEGAARAEHRIGDEEPKTKAVAIRSKMTDAEVLKLMFKSKHGKEIRELYDGDASGHKNDLSSADMSLCAHLAFWTARDQAQMERIWLASPLGQREKTQKRKDYRDRTVANAAANCKEAYEPMDDRMERAEKESRIDLLWIRDSEGKKQYVTNTENMRRVIGKHADFSGRLRYDEFKAQYEVLDGKKWREMMDMDVLSFQTALSVLFPAFLRVRKEMVQDAMVMVARANAMDSASDWVKGLKWDGVSRLDGWLNSAYGAPIDEYHVAVASNWMKGLVSRITDPGCKFDHVLVLEGEQGSRKSTSLAVLGGSWHVETTMSTDNKDFFMQFAGKAIVEFSEGETMSRTEVKKMKAIITTQVDRYRAPWGKTSQDFPRRCVFAMTTNQTEYLKDETGNRRWLPVRLGSDHANIDWLKENREQLYAEAYYRVSALKEGVHEFPKEETERQQALRRVRDPNAELIANWYWSVLSTEERSRGITVHQVWQQALGNVFGSRDLSKHHEMAIADTLRSHVNLEKRQAMDHGVRMTRWYAPDPTGGMTPEQEIIAFVEGAGF